MTVMPNDIVYILKEDIQPAELIYSLRSVEKNFPFNKVWFICGQPKGLKPDGRIVHKQTGKTKWDWIKSSMIEVIRNDDITEDFYLFNDDFFVMQRVEGEFVNLADRTLSARIEEFKEENPWLNHYARTLVKAREELKVLGCPEVNYDVHMPMLFDKANVTETLARCSSPQMRSIYGNINRVPFKDHPDCKIYSLETVPILPDFLSTNENTFANGKVGTYIRATFTHPSRFEL